MRETTHKFDLRTTASPAARTIPVVSHLPGSTSVWAFAFPRPATDGWSYPLRNLSGPPSGGAAVRVRKARALPANRSVRRKTSCLPGSNCHSEGRGFLSSLFSPFLGTTHGQESSEISTPVLNSTLGGRGVLFRSCLLFVLQSVASLLSLGVYL